MARTALLGGKPVFDGKQQWPRWPVATAADEQRVLKVIRGDQWGIGCPETARFAERFARSVGARFALPVGTGTAALELAVKALGIEPGDEVIVPAYTFVASATCVLEVGATPVFADIDPQTLNIDPAVVERLITTRTRAVIPVHFGGNPCDMQRLKDLADRNGLEVIEDAAHAHGMLYRGRAAGTIGRAGCFSFQSSKNMTAGEGGALVTDDEDVFRRAESFHSFGRQLGRPWYEHHSMSWNHRITGFQSALLLGQLGRLEAQTRRRLENGRLLNEALGRLPGQRPQADGDRSSSTRRAWHIYIWLYDPDAVGVDHGTFVKALQAEGVPAGPGYPVPLQRNAMFLERRFWHSHGLGDAPARREEPDYSLVQTPVTEEVCARAIWLAQEKLLAPRRDVQRIAEAVAKVIENADELRAWARSRSGA